MSGAFSHVFARRMSSPAHSASSSCCLIQLNTSSRGEVNKTCRELCALRVSITRAHLKPRAGADNPRLPSDDNVCIDCAPPAPVMLITVPLTCCGGPRRSAGFACLMSTFFKKSEPVFWGGFFPGNYCCFIIATPEPPEKEPSQTRTKPVTPVKRSCFV